MIGIIDIIVIVLFIAILAVFIIGFNRQMLALNEKRAKDAQERRKNKDNKSKDDIND